MATVMLSHPYIIHSSYMMRVPILFYRLWSLGGEEAKTLEGLWQAQFILLQLSEHHNIFSQKTCLYEAVWKHFQHKCISNAGTMVQSLDFECTFKMEKTFQYLQIAAGCWIIYIVPHAGRHKIQHPETVPATHWVLRTYLCLQHVWEKRLLNSLCNSAFLETEFVLSKGFRTDEAGLIITKPSNLYHYLGFHVSHCDSFSPLSSGGESSGWRSLARLEPFMAGWAFPS